MNQPNSLSKGLKTRHMTMISIAGVIGAGLFVGSGSVIHSTGPGAIVSYALAGLLVIFIMRMLGEMSSVNPTSGSFSQYAHDAIGPWAGFTIGWLYWFFWVIVIAIEAIAGAGIIQYWFPGIPLWLTSLLLTVLLTLTNIYSVKSFGEFEYWLSLVKVATIVVFLIAGFAFIFGIVPAANRSGWKIWRAAADFSLKVQVPFCSASSLSFFLSWDLKSSQSQREKRQIRSNPSQRRPAQSFGGSLFFTSAPLRLWSHCCRGIQPIFWKAPSLPF